MVRLLPESELVFWLHERHLAACGLLFGQKGANHLRAKPGDDSGLGM
jgi:hypothetical protein